MEIKIPCLEFEDRLTDYLEGALTGDIRRQFAEHALRCLICHELLKEVKEWIIACRSTMIPAPSAELGTSILRRTALGSPMTCE